MALFLPIFFSAILFTKSLVSFNLYLLLFIVVPKFFFFFFFFFLIICFIKLNLSSDTFTQFEVDQSDSFFNSSSVTLSVIFLGASKSFSRFVFIFLLLDYLIMLPLFLINLLKLIKALFFAAKISFFCFSVLSVIFSTSSEIILFSANIILVKTSYMVEDSSVASFLSSKSINKSYSIPTSSKKLWLPMTGSSASKIKLI